MTDEIERIINAHATRMARIKGHRTRAANKAKLAERIHKLDVFNPVDVPKRVLAHLDVLLPMAFGHKTRIYDALSAISRHPATYWHRWFHTARRQRRLGRAGLDELITAMDAHIRGVRDHLNDMETELEAIKRVRQDWTVSGRERESFDASKKLDKLAAEDITQDAKSPAWWLDGK